MPDREKYIEILSKAVKTVKEFNEDTPIKISLECVEDILELLKEQDPICMLWENDTSPMWVLNPNDIHEPAFLMGKLKLFTGKPTFEQCKAVKWE